MVYWADLMYEKADENTAAYEGQLENTAAALDGADVPPPTNAGRSGIPRWPGEAAHVSHDDELETRAACDPGRASRARAHSAAVAAEEEFMNAYLRDVHHYLFDVEFAPPGKKPPVRIQQTIRKRFVDAVCHPETSRPHIVVSHSMGTVIAYDCLRRVDDCATVDGLITIGSPLGLDEVQDKLKPEWSRPTGSPRARRRRVDQPIRSARSRLRVRPQARQRLSGGRCGASPTSRCRTTVVAALGHEVLAATGVLQGAASRLGALSACTTAEERTLDALRKQTRETLPRLNAYATKRRSKRRCPAREAPQQTRARRAGELAEALGRLTRPGRLNPKTPPSLLRTGADRDRQGDRRDRRSADLGSTLKEGRPEALEVAGLLGRSYKQIFFDSRDRTSMPARDALKQAVAAYRKPYEENRANTWHGVNLLALTANARRLGIRLTKLDPRSRARTPGYAARSPLRNGRWHLPTLAEVSLGRTTGTRSISSYGVRRLARLQPSKSPARCASSRKSGTSRTMSADAMLVNILRARLMQLPGGRSRCRRKDLQRLSDAHPRRLS